jgi:hypothetical protein
MKKAVVPNANVDWVKDHLLTFFSFLYFCLLHFDKNCLFLVLFVFVFNNHYITSSCI